MKIFIVLCESPLKILKIAVYHFLISFLVPELLMFKDLQNGLKMVAIAMMSVPDPFSEYHEMKHNSAITRQNQLEFWDQNAKQGFS